MTKVVLAVREALAGAPVTGAEPGQSPRAENRQLHERARVNVQFVRPRRPGRQSLDSSSVSDFVLRAARGKWRSPFAPETIIFLGTAATFLAEKRRSSRPARFVDLDRQTPMVLPDDLRELYPQTALHPQKPRGRGVNLQPEPSPARKNGPVPGKNRVRRICVRSPPPQNHFLGLTHCNAQARPKWRQPFE